MNILLLASEPFYQERGTPIAVHLLLKTLSERGDRVDVLTYHEGKNINYKNISLHRIPNLSFIKHVPPGFSWKKIICDIFLLSSVINCVGRRRYEIIHAVEESVFIAVLMKILFKIPYIYDMDSSLAHQMVEKYPFLHHFSKLLELIERFAVTHCIGVVTICSDLAAVVNKYAPDKKVWILHDVSLISPAPGQVAHARQPDLKKDPGLDGIIVMYIGNLESYQGIDLLLESYERIVAKVHAVNLVIIGGTPDDISKYKIKAEKLGINGKVHFLGPRPVDELGLYLAQADILVSPRIKGENTPMKIYSYLHSGKAVVATDIRSHTQVLNDKVSALAAPRPDAFSDVLLSLIDNKSLRLRLGRAGKKLMEEKYSYDSFKNTLNVMYTDLGKRITADKRRTSQLRRER